MILFNFSHLPQVQDKNGVVYQPSAQGMVQEEAEVPLEVTKGTGELKVWEDWLRESEVALP